MSNTEKKIKNQFNPRKLILSKWTSVVVTNKEKHFIVNKVNLKAGSVDQVESIEIEAILSKTNRLIPWQELKDPSKWLQGWQ